MADGVILKGDCFELFRELPDHCADLILTDPPYNLAQYSTGNISRADKAAINNDIADWDRKELDIKALAPEFKRLLAPTGNLFIFCAHNQFGDWHKLIGPEYDTFQFVVWHKTNPTPCLRKTTFLKSCELIVCVWNKGHTWNFTTQNEMHNFIETPICMGSERLKEPKHPAQKPLRVLEHLIRLGSNPGDMVLDPFCGVGSTAVAAIGLDRNFIGMEIDEVYYQAAIKRMNEAIEKQNSLPSK